MESNPEQLRLMAVHAHPDDESSKGAATMARYVREGVEVMVCTLTGGERGDILNPAMDRPEIKADIAAVRRTEMARARQILGVEQRFLGFVDSGLPEGDPKPPLPEGSFALTPVAEAAEPLVRAIREFHERTARQAEFGPATLGLACWLHREAARHPRLRSACKRWIG